ncbi:helix-turn-helix transcriptional regulator [Actinoplanes sp. NBRC 103695]|uniref:helix-turn-helix domain-containing protein n=1 Tax=Actinoplanes sp. NBRC 103695 TaxID=3032202 RepID=UPI0025574017|nr:helix-turn-helix transcriptional regulator [Actinoplanes sp. NBRC 103695]GLY99301.1 hypothetical protein Acsp02_65540 [Actinoplanes sp. NBRC 103695]
MTMDTARAFAARLRQLRQRRGLSVRELSGIVKYSKSQVNDLETGRRRPNPDSARRLDEALSASGTLAGLICPTPPDEPPVIGLTPMSTPAPLDEEDLLRVRETVQHLVAMDTMHGSEGSHSIGVRAFRNAHRRLSETGVKEGLRREIHASVAELGEVAAWLAYDSDRQDLSRAVATEAMVVAHLAGDTDMVRFLLSHLSMQAAFQGRGAEALDLADRVLADEPRSGRVIGMMRVRRARAFGELGDGASALAELERASGQLAGELGTNDPPWTWWLHTAELAVHEARIKSAGGDLNGAVEASERSVCISHLVKAEIRRVTVDDGTGSRRRHPAPHRVCRRRRRRHGTRRTVVQLPGRARAGFRPAQGAGPPGEPEAGLAIADRMIVSLADLKAQSPSATAAAIFSQASLVPADRPA